MKIKSRKIRISIWVVTILVTVSISCWAYIRHDKIDFLRYGILRINKMPGSLRMIDYSTYGASDFRAEYYVSISPLEFNKLLAGRNYKVKRTNYGELNSMAVNDPRHSFSPENCYFSGSIQQGLVNIFINKEKSLLYFVYDVR